MNKLLQKDMLHYMRVGGKFFLPLGILFSGFMYSILYSDFSADIAAISIKSSMIFSGPSMIAVIAILLIQSSFAAEKQDKTIIVLLANGFCPEHIWLSKLLVAYIAGYLCFVVSIGINEIVVYIQWNLLLTYSWQDCILMLIVYPVIAFSMVTILWLVVWITKRLGIYLIGFVPVCIYMASVYLSLFMVENNISVGLKIVAFVLVVAIIITMCTIYFIRRVNYEYLANIHT